MDLQSPRTCPPLVCCVPRAGKPQITLWAAEGGLSGRARCSCRLITLDPGGLWPSYRQPSEHAYSYVWLACCRRRDLSVGTGYVDKRIHTYTSACIVVSEGVGCVVLNRSFDTTSPPLRVPHIRSPFVWGREPPARMYGSASSLAHTPMRYHIRWKSGLARKRPTGTGRLVTATCSPDGGAASTAAAEGGKRGRKREKQEKGADSVC